MAAAKKTTKTVKKATSKAVSKPAKKAVSKSAVAVTAKASPAVKGKPCYERLNIVNIVVSTALEHDVPLEKMAATLSNTEYNPEQFPGLVLRIKDPKTSALIFSSGKVVCTGARTIEKVEESIQQIIKSLEKINIKITIKPVIKIQNVVASGRIDMELNLNNLAMQLENTEYEPEQFPGLVYKLMEAKATFLLFSNGELVCTGTRSEQEVFTAVEMLVKRLTDLGLKFKSDK